MTREEKQELEKLIDAAIDGSLATNDDELYEDAQRDMNRIQELLDKIQVSPNE